MLEKEQNKWWILKIVLSLSLLIFVAVSIYIQTNNYKEENSKREEELKMTFEGENPVVTILMEDGEEIKLELYPEEAPNTVKNFIFLIEENFYDGLIFHRVIENFMIQGGDPEGTGMGGPGYSIKGEFRSNGYPNELEHERGVISMARSQHPDSAGSQFFIVHEDANHLDGQYAAFGKVIEGMDIVDKIAGIETGRNDRPVEDQVIESMTVETFDYDFDEPERME